MHTHTDIVPYISHRNKNVKLKILLEVETGKEIKLSVINKNSCDITLMLRYLIINF